jgi:hypothetical protein
MAGSMHELSPWNRRQLTIPPDSPRTWLRLAVWQCWIGVLLCGIIGFGTMLIVTAPDRLITVQAYAGCHTSQPFVQPCQRTDSADTTGVVYRTGALYALFSVLAGVLMFVLAAWFLWELWGATTPKPITDDFLALLHYSFARQWRDPRTWPWARLGWSYGFTLLGAAATAGAAVLFWSLLAPPREIKRPIIQVETSEIFRLGVGR